MNSMPKKFTKQTESLKKINAWNLALLLVSEELKHWCVPGRKAVSLVICGS